MRALRSALLTAVTAAAALAAVAVPASAQPLAENYVALGDSYASGTGAGDYGDSGGCKRSANAYAPLWAGAHGASLTFVACSGAVTSDVLSDQVGSLDSSTSMVTISIGGNDAGFVDVITTCTLGSDDTCVNRVNEAKDFVSGTLTGRLDSVYSEISSRAPSARVVVLGYPHMYQVPGSCSVGLSDVKRAAINSAADALDETTADRASAAGFDFADPRGTFSGHEICSSNSWLHSLTVPVDESYHPTAAGHSGGYLPALTAVTG